MTKHFNAIRHAWHGIVWGLQTQPNYRVHILFSILSLIAALLLNISYGEWLIILVMIILGFVIETINTAIEQLGDAIDVNHNDHIRRAKDSSAGAMLIFSCGAVIVAAIIFLPKIL